MMVEKEDLGLSLSLSSGSSNRFSPLQLNLMPPSSSSVAPSRPPQQPFIAHQRAPQAPWTDLFVASSSSPDVTARPFLKGIDVNRPPPPAAAGEREANEEEEEAGVSSPNSTVSSVLSGGCGKRSEREHDCHPRHHHGGSIGDESELERACSRGISDEEDGGEGSRKKLRLSKDQSAVLEESFKEHNTLNPKQKEALAKQLNLRPRQVEVWFQNRRARTKLKQTEVDCEFLKRCCENLTEENRRLQKEVQELRALKLSPQFYMHMTPPTTLTMCPSCERVAVSSSPTAAVTSPSSSAPSALPAKPLAADNHHYHLLPQQQKNLHHHPNLLPRHLHPAAAAGHHHRPIPIAPAASHSLPWPPAPLRAVPAFVDAPTPRS